MKKYKQALIIGRFQPLCNHHLDLFEQAKEYADILLIAIGRPNYKRAKEILTPEQFTKYKLKNLFSFKRTRQVIEIALKGTKHKIVPIKDIFDPDNYAEYVIKEFSKHGVKIENCMIFGENEYTFSCFAKTNIDTIHSQKRLGYHATDVRREIMKQGKTDRLAFKPTKKEIQKIKYAQERLE